jgi:hypothetical protein
VHVEANEHQSRVVFRAVTWIAFVRKPRPPVRRIELVDLLAVARDGRDPQHGHPLACPILVERQVEVRIRCQVPQLRCSVVRHEPQVCSSARFCGAIARDRRCPSARRVVIMAISMSSMWSYSLANSRFMLFTSSGLGRRTVGSSPDEPPPWSPC